MRRFLLFVALTLSTLGLANATVGAAELTGSTEAQSSDAKMPAGADFSNGPAGGGAPRRTCRRLVVRVATPW